MAVQSNGAFVVPGIASRGRAQEAIPDGAGVFGVIRPDGSWVRLLGVRPYDATCTVRVGRNELAVPECAEPLSAVSSNGSVLVVATTAPLDGHRATLRITAVGGTGDTLFTQSIPLQGTPIDPSAADSIRVKRAKQVRDPALARMVQDMKLPDVFREAERLVVGNDSAVWIGLRPKGDVRPWLLLADGGRIRGAVDLPRQLRLLAVRRDTVWGTEADADGLDAIVRYRVVQ